MKIPKVTFKNDQKAKGLARVTEFQGADIKLDGKIIGRISAPHWSGDFSYKVKFTIKNENNFKWISLKYEGSSLNSTKDWLKENWLIIYEKYKDDFWFREIQ